MESGARMPLRPYLSLLIAVPYDDGVSPEELKEMISDINDNVVENIDQLSNNAYILSEEGLKIA